MHSAREPLITPLITQPKSVVHAQSKTTRCLMSDQKNLDLQYMGPVKLAVNTAAAFAFILWMTAMIAVSLRQSIVR